MQDPILEQLVALSNELGRPELDYVILGEGNTSARADDASFFVKGSGTQLRTITGAGFVRVGFEPVLALVEKQGLTDEDVKAALTAAKIDPTQGPHPSVETLLHGLCLQLPGINFVGHTHATAVNMLTCSVGFEQAFAGRLFPDEIVLCGPAPVLVPYTDPGVPLALEVWGRIQAYMQAYGEQPQHGPDAEPRRDRARAHAPAGARRDGHGSEDGPGAARHVRRGWPPFPVRRRRQPDSHPPRRVVSSPATEGVGPYARSSLS